MCQEAARGGEIGSPYYHCHFHIRPQGSPGSNAVIDTTRSTATPGSTCSATPPPRPDPEMIDYLPYNAFRQTRWHESVPTKPLLLDLTLLSAWCRHLLTLTVIFHTSLGPGGRPATPVPHLTLICRIPLNSKAATSKSLAAGHQAPSTHTTSNSMRYSAK